MASLEVAFRLGQADAVTWSVWQQLKIMTLRSTYYIDVPSRALIQILTQVNHRKKVNHVVKLENVLRRHSRNPLTIHSDGRRSSAALSPPNQTSWTSLLLSVMMLASADTQPYGSEAETPTWWRWLKRGLNSLTSTCLTNLISDSLNDVNWSEQSRGWARAPTMPFIRARLVNRAMKVTWPRRA